MHCPGIRREYPILCYFTQIHTTQTVIHTRSARVRGRYRTLAHNEDNVTNVQDWYKPQMINRFTQREVTDEKLNPK